MATSNQPIGLMGLRIAAQATRGVQRCGLGKGTKGCCYLVLAGERDLAHGDIVGLWVITGVLAAVWADQR